MRVRWLGLILLTLFTLGNSVSTMANPTDGQVAAGNATIEHNGDTTTINQSSEKAIINWKTFNINQGQTTQFNQPSASSIALNRVNASYGASRIMGNLFANGHVWIINPAGIMFGPSAQVNVAGLLATTSNINDQDFLNGNYHFMQQPGFANGAVVNQGTIKIKDGGMVALVAPGVENSGVIQANMGTVALSSGNNYTVDFYGDKLIKFDVNNQVMSRAIDADGRTLNDAVTNSGTIISDGGKVLMTAQVAQNVVDNVINMKGYVQANSIGTRGGEIVLAGGDQGIVRVTGKVTARGNNVGTKGGKIQITGKYVGLYGATVDASGYSGGGSVEIGGSAEGKGPLPNSDAIYISPDSTISADALINGDGGRIVTFAENSAKIYGKLSAMGGAEGGNGGFIETSSHGYFDISNVPNVAAPYGKGGTWLIDPFDIEIISGGSSSGIDQSGNDFTATSNDATLGVDLIISALLNGDVIVSTGTGGSQTGNITLDAVLAYTTTVANTLTLSAAGSIVLNQPIQPANSNATTNVVLNADTNNDGTGEVQINNTLQTNGGTLTISAQDLDLGINGLINTTSTDSQGSVTFNALRDVGLGTAGTASISNSDLAKITTGSLSISAGENENLIVSGISASNLANIDQLNLSTSGSSAAFIFNGSPSTFKNLTATSDSGIDVDENVTASGDITFNSGSDQAVVIAVSTLSSTAGNIILNTASLSLDNNAFLSVSSNNSITINSEGAVGLGTADTLGLDLNNTQLANISAGTLTFNAGNTNSSNIVVTDAAFSGSIDNLVLNATNNVNSQINFENGTTGSTIAGTLTANANSSIAVTNHSLTVGGNVLSLNADADNNASGSLTVNQSLAISDPTTAITLTGFGVTTTVAIGVASGGLLVNGHGGTISLGGTLTNNNSANITIRNGSSVTLPTITSGNTGLLTLGVDNDLGTVTQAGGSSLQNQVLSASTFGDINLTNTNSLSSINTVSSGGSFSLVNNGSISITNSVAADGALNLTSNSGSITSNGAISSGGAATLTAATSITLNSSFDSDSTVTLTANNGGITATGRVTGTTLNATTLGGSGHDIDLQNSANDFDDVNLIAGTIADPTVSDILYTDTDSFNIIRASNIAANITFNSINGGITQSGAITGIGGTLTVNTATGSILNNSSNEITNYAATNSGTGNIEFTNNSLGSGSGQLNTIGDITQSGTGNISIINTGTFNVLNDVTVTSGNITLSALGANKDLNLSPSVPGNIAISGNASSNIFTFTAGRNIAITNHISTPGSIVFNAGTSSATGTITESGSGVILGGAAVTATSIGGLTLNNSSNQIDQLTATNSGSGNISVINDNTAMIINGISQTGGGTVTVTNNGASGDITIAGNISNDASSVTLTSGNNISGTSGAISAPSSTVAMTAANSISLANNPISANNNIDLTATNGSISLAGGAASTLGILTLTANQDIELNSGVFSAPDDISMTAGGAITGSKSATVETTTFTATAANGINLPATGNKVSFLNLTNTASGNLIFANDSAALSVDTMSQTGGGNVSVTNTGTLSLNTPISTTGNITLAGSTITQTGLSTITGNALALYNSSNTVLTQDINVHSVSANNVSGTFNLVNDLSSLLSITGITYSGNGTITITNPGDLLFQGNINIDNAQATFTSLNDGTINFSAAFTSSNQGVFAFNNPITLTGESSFNTNGANLTFNQTIDGNQIFNLNTGTGNLVFDKSVGSSTALAQLIVNNTNNFVNNGNIYTGKFIQRSGTGVTNLGTSLYATDSVSITTNNLIGNLETPALAIDTNTANITGLVNGRSDLFGAAQIDVLNVIMPETHFFNGIDLFPYTEIGDVSHYFLNTFELEGPYDNAVTNYWYITEALKQACYRSAAFESDCLQLYVDDRLVQ